MEYNVKKIGKRIKELRESMRIDEKPISVEMFCKSIHISSRKTYYCWINGETMPEPATLNEMCDFFDCDMGYLLCEYDCKRKENIDICKATGLSEQAVESLKKSSTIQPAKPRKKLDPKIANEKVLASTINLLLSDTKNGLPILQSIADYIYSDGVDVSVRAKDKKDYSGLLHVKNHRTNSDYEMSQTDIDSLLLTQIQANLIRLKQNIQH